VHAGQRAIVVVDVATAVLVVEAGRTPLPRLAPTFCRQQGIRALRTDDAYLAAALLIATRRGGRLCRPGGRGGADGDTNQETNLERVHGSPPPRQSEAPAADSASQPCRHPRGAILNYSLTNPRMPG